MMRTPGEYIFDFSTVILGVCPHLFYLGRQNVDTDIRCAEIEFIREEVKLVPHLALLLH